MKLVNPFKSPAPVIVEKIVTVVEPHTPAQCFECLRAVFRNDEVATHVLGELEHHVTNLPN